MSLKISIITSTRNCIRTIGDTLDSLENQDYKLKECIWIDGASTDGTSEYLASRSINFDSVYISEPDNGIYDALNKGLQLVSGDIIGFLHADDVLADKSVLSSIANAFKDPAVDAVYGDLIYVREYDLNAAVRYWRPGFFTKRKLNWGWMPPHPALYLRREVYERIGQFDTCYKVASDYDYILKVFTSPNFKSIYLPKVLVRMRMGGLSNGSLPMILRKSLEDYQALRRNKVGGLGALIYKNISKLTQFL